MHLWTLLDPRWACSGFFYTTYKFVSRQSPTNFSPTRCWGRVTPLIISSSPRPSKRLWFCVASFSIVWSFSCLTIVHSPTDHQIHFFTLPNLEPLEQLIKPLRNVVTFALDDAQQQRKLPTDRRSQQPEVVNLCVIKRSSIMIYSLGPRLQFRKACNNNLVKFPVKFIWVYADI